MNLSIQTPTLLLDRYRCLVNIDHMIAKAKRHNISLRPHFKTHQSRTIGQWYAQRGVEKITVSSVAMAEYFASDWSDITIAFPTNILELKRIEQLTEQVQINVLVESLEVAIYLKENLKQHVGVFIKIDVGYGRTGIAAENLSLIQSLVTTLENANNLDFKGFLAHAGHTYQCRSKMCIEQTHALSLKRMQTLKEHFINHPRPLEYSYGDTPSCSVAEDFTGMTELRPGNFVFYDLTQRAIGSNAYENIAVAMACPIVALHRERQEVVVYGGGVHFSKDRLEHPDYGTIFGRVVVQTETGWGEVIPDAYVRSLSQEHGIIRLPKALMAQQRIGDFIFVLPVHSCMAANLQTSYLTTEGEWIERL
ncbi:MAG: alanine racemase [Saprospiraceae bacterium]